MRPSPMMPSVAPCTSTPVRSLGPQVFPLAGADVVHAFDHSPRRGHEEREGQVGGRLGQNARRVADRDAALGRGPDVDVVEADRVVRYDAQARTAVHQLRVDAVGQEREQPLGLPRLCEQPLARRRKLLLPKLHVGRLADHREAPVGDRAGDEYSWLHAARLPRVLNFSAMRGSHHIGRALRNSALLWAGAVLLPALSPRGDAAGDGRVTFHDITSAAGIRFVNAAAPEKRYIVESMPGGVALFDFDRDGRLDVYLVNSYTVEAALGGRPRAALYRKRLDGAFEDVAEKAGVADPGWGMGV